MLNDTIQNFICKVGIIPIFIQKVLFLHNLIKIINIYVRKYIPIYEVGMNVIAEGRADFVQNKIPVSQVGTNIDTVGYVRKYISISENRNECYRRGEGGLRPKNKHQYLEYEQILVQRATCVNIYQYMK